MRRTLVYILAGSLVLAAGAYAQGQQRQQAPNRQQQIQRPMMGQRMGMRGQGMGMRMMNRNDVEGGGGMQAVRPMRGADDLYLSLRDVLDLTDDQVKELRQLRVDHIKTTGTIETDLQVARLELRDLLDSDTPKMNAIEDKISDIHDLEAQLETAQLRMRFDSQAVLTPEQLEQVQTAPRGRAMGRGMTRGRN